MVRRKPAELRGSAGLLFTLRLEKMRAEIFKRKNVEHDHKWKGQC